MKYYYEKPDIFTASYGSTYKCDHPNYNSCTLYFSKGMGLAVIQERFNPILKTRWWGPIDPWLVDDIYNQKGFKKYFKEHSGAPEHDIFPTVTVRQIMWALRMKPLQREHWESQ